MSSRRFPRKTRDDHIESELRRPLARRVPLEAHLDALREPRPLESTGTGGGPGEIGVAGNGASGGEQD